MDGNKVDCGNVVVLVIIMVYSDDTDCFDGDSKVGYGNHTCGGSV